MFHMPFMLLKNHFLYSGCHSCFKICIFYSPAAICALKYVPVLCSGSQKLHFCLKHPMNYKKTRLQAVKAIPMPVLERRPPKNESFRAYTAHAANPSPCRVQVRSGQVRPGQVRSGQVRSGQVRSGNVVSILFQVGVNFSRIRGGGGGRKGREAREVRFSMFRMAFMLLK